MEEEKDLELRSEEVKEIMGKPPSWIIRWGSTVAFAVVALLILFACWFRYPDLRVAPIELTTAIPPAEVVATVNATIEKIFVSENQSVGQDENLAILSSTANYVDVGLFEAKIRELQDATETEIMAFSLDAYQIGELQPAYSQLREYLETLSRDKNTAFDRQSINKLYASKSSIRDAIGFEKEALSLHYIELGNVRADQERVKDLYVKKIKAHRDLELANATVSGVRAKIKRTQSQIASKQKELNQIDQEIFLLRENRQVTTSFNYVKVKEEINRVLSAIESWKEKYILTAPIDGVIAFPDNHNENQHVRQNEKILNVIPDKGGKWILQGLLPTRGAGKVERGQRAIVKFDNYPFQDYGIIEGVVDEISLMPRGNEYNITIQLKNGLVTSHRDTLLYNQGMKGIAEIETDNKSLMAWLFNRLVSRVRNQ